MTLSEKLQTPEAKAIQVVLARIIDLVPNADDSIELAESDYEALKAYVDEAVLLNPTNEEAIAAAVLLVSTTAEKSHNDKFKAFASKVVQEWAIISDITLSALDKIVRSIGVLFQGKRKAVRKL